MQQIYVLKYPFTTDAGKRIEQLELRRLTRADLKAAYKNSKDEADQEDFLLGRMTGLIVEDVGGLDIADAKALTDFFRDMVAGPGNPEGA